MTFSHPIALILTALALPIIALYILKVRLRRVPVSTNMFWKQIYDEKPPRSFWQQFRHLFSLLMQLLLLLLLTIAVADPYFSGQLRESRRLVLVFDNSASMRATDAQPSRLEAARRAALELIDGLHFRDELAIVLAGERPEILSGMTDHIPTLKDVIRKIPVSDNPTFLRPAIELAKTLIGQHPHGYVIVMTDGCAESPEVILQHSTVAPTDTADPAGRELAETSQSGGPPEKVAGATDQLSPSVEFRLFGTDSANIGITQFQVRRSQIDPTGYTIFMSVKNASVSPAACRLELTMNDLAVDIIPLRLKPEEHWVHTIEKTSLDGGQVRAALTQITVGEESLSDSDRDKTTAALAGSGTPNTEADSLETDNTAWAILSARKIQPVLLITPGNLFLRTAFEANPLVEITIRKDFPEVWPADAVIVLHGRVPSILPPGNVFVIDPFNSCDHWELGEPLENPVIVTQDTASPLMTSLSLENVVMSSARILRFTTPPHALATTISGDAVLAEVERNNGKCLVLSVNLDNSDLVFRTTFPILVSNLLNWYSGTTGELQQALSTGSVTDIFLPQDPQSGISLLSPAGQILPVAFSDADNDSSDQAVLAAGPFTEAGIWKVIPNSHKPGDKVSPLVTGVAEVAVNLTNLRETDLRPPAALQTVNSGTLTEAGWFSRPLWVYLTLSACVLTTIEWFLYQRRLIA